MMFRRAILTFSLLYAPACAFAAPGAVDELLARYAAQGAAKFDAAAGESMWNRPFAAPGGGEPRRCSTCHTSDLRAAGKHATTGKAIEPLATSVNANRLTDVAKIEKWLLRNCKWTLGRECTPQEKGDYLTMIRSK